MGICCSALGSASTSTELTPAPAPTATNLSSSPPYAVFISHAGEDKATIALPLREKLRAQGITAFVDEADIPCGTDAIQAMIRVLETAKVGVIILSPEFVAKKWPMKEAMHFLRRIEECSREGHRGRAPTIIPCFYRLSVDDLYKEPRLRSKDPYYKELYRKSRFLERQKNGEPEANIKRVKATLKKLHCPMGVRNDFDANNDSSFVMSKRRDMLLDELCGKICKNVPEGMKKTKALRNTAQIDIYRPSFPPKLIGKSAVLDFGSRDAKGHPVTPEGRAKKYLLEEDSQPTGIVSVCGIGGVGKSTIVNVLLSDDDVRQRFPDGVYFIKLGRNATSNALLQCLCKILEEFGAERDVQELREGTNIETALSHFLEWFEGRSSVFFIDDVWERSVNLQALSRLCDVVSIVGRNRVLITTREHEIASLTRDARIVSLDPRESKGEVARKILLFHSDVVENDVAMADAAGPISEILGICAGLPVSLAVAGKNVRMLIKLDRKNAASVWTRYLSQLQASHDTLLRQTVKGYGDLYATFAASLNFLDERTTEETLGFATKFSFPEMYRRLCVLQKQAAVPNTMLMHLWKTENKERAYSIARVFVEVGLAGQEMAPGKYEWEWRLTLHDSVHDFAISEARRHGEIVDAHNLLLEGYGSGYEDSQSNDSRVRWWSRELRDDGYIHEHLCRHLVGSERKRELCWLLLTPLWAERQIEVSGITHLEDDFSTGMKEIRENHEPEAALSLIASAVSLSSGFVRTNIAELWFQLHGRLKGCVQGNRAIDKYVKWIETDSPKRRVLSVNRILVGAGGRNRKILSAERLGVDCMAMYPDEERIACGCGDGSVVVINIRRSEIERKWKAYKGEYETVSSIAVAQNRSRIVTVSRKQNTLDVWDVDSGNHVETSSGHLDHVNCFGITHDEKSVVSVSTAGSLQFRDLRTDEVVGRATNVGSEARNIILLRDGERAIIEHEDSRPKIWNIRTGAEIGEFGDSSDQVRCVAVTPGDRQVVTGSHGGKVTLWDLKSRQEIWSEQVWVWASGLEAPVIESLAASKDGKRIASGDESGAIRIWDVNSGEDVCSPLSGHTHNVTGVSFLGSNDSLVSSSWDGTVRTWDFLRGQDQTSFHGHESIVTGVSFTPDSLFVVTGSWDHTLRIWDATSGQPVGDPLQGHSDAVNDVAVTADGQFVVSVSSDKTVRVWHLDSCNLLLTFPGHTGSVTCVATAAKGNRVVTGSMDGTVRVWDLEKMDGTFVTFDEHTSPVKSVYVSDDELRVISVDASSIILWYMETQNIIRTKHHALYEYDVMMGGGRMSRREVFSLIRERTIHDDAGLSIPLFSNQIIHDGSKACVLATLGHKVACWDISPDKKTICVGLYNGQVALLKVDV